MAKLMRRNERSQSDDLGQSDPFRGTLSRMDPFRMVREMFQDPFGGTGLLADNVFRPNLDVTETNDAFEINVDLPGVGEEDIEVQITGNRLTINGRREAEQTREGDRYVAVERAYGTFTRSFVLPDSADTEQVEARLENGVLKVRVPKRGEMKGRKVSIQGRQGAQASLGQGSETSSTQGSQTGQTSASAQDQRAADTTGDKQVQIQEEAARKAA
jgi:HSP20 family protein